MTVRERLALLDKTCIWKACCFTRAEGRLLLWAHVCVTGTTWVRSTRASFSQKCRVQSMSWLAKSSRSSRSAKSLCQDLSSGMPLLELLRSPPDVSHYVSVLESSCPYVKILSGWYLLNHQSLCSQSWHDDAPWAGIAWITLSWLSSRSHSSLI